MKTLLAVLLLSYMPSLFADDRFADDLFSDDRFVLTQAKWQDVDHRATLATRLSHHKVATTMGSVLSESTLISDHQYQSLIAVWRLDNQLYQPPTQTGNDSHGLQSDTQFKLSELSYSFSLLASENDFWQLGQFNSALDPGYALRSVGFFESTNNPFDDFASTQGLQMANVSLWLDDYYLSLLLALEGNSVATENLKQWALVLQKDYFALSSSFMLQQYEGNNIGLGATFTYVVGNSWEFHGSIFTRRGSVWRDQFSDSTLTIAPHYNGQAEEDQWLPKGVIGSVWTSTHLQLLMEYSYQKEKLSQTQINAINDFQPQSLQQAQQYQNHLIELYTQAYQQHYLFAQLQYTLEDHIITANSLIGGDISALSQLKYEYLATFNLSGWLSMELASGTSETEFKRTPWQNRVQIGLQWKI